MITKQLNPDYILKEIVEIPSGALVGDLGCGSMAFFTVAASKLVGDKGRVFACDVLKEVLSSVEAKIKQLGLYNVKTVWTNLEIVGATKIDQPLDYVFLTTTLFQSKNYLEMFKEAFRLLKPAGKLLVIEWKASSGPIGPAQDLRLPKEAVEQLAKETNFAKIKEFEASSSHYGYIFQK